MIGKRPLINRDQTYAKALGLNKPPFEPDPDRRFYFSFKALEQRLGVLRGLMASQDVLILVLGERGIGKTTLLHRYLDTSRVAWKLCRIRNNADGCRKLPTPNRFYKDPAYILQDKSYRTVLIDDAHLLETATLNFFLKKLAAAEQPGKANRLVLFGEPHLSTNLTLINNTLDDNIAVSKIFIPVLTQLETSAYLRHRLSIAGASNPYLFSRRAVKKLHRSTGGLPGRINAAADIWLQKRKKPALPMASNRNPTRMGPLRRFLNDVTAAGELLAAGTFLRKNQSENRFRTRKMVSSPKMPKEPMSPGEKNATCHAIFREDWLLCQDPKHYTVQVLGVKSEKAITSIVKTHRLPAHRQIACFRTFYKGETAYPLLWGVYRTRLEASAAVDDLPDKLRDFFPLIRRISVIQQAIQASDSP